MWGRLRHWPFGKPFGFWTFVQLFFCKCWTCCVGALLSPFAVTVLHGGICSGLCETFLRAVSLLPAHIASSLSSHFKPRNILASFSSFSALLKWRGSTLARCIWPQTHTVSRDAEESYLGTRRKDKALAPSFLSHPHTCSCA